MAAAVREWGRGRPACVPVPSHVCTTRDRRCTAGCAGPRSTSSCPWLCVVCLWQGRNTGRVGVLVSRDRHPGSFDIVHVKDSEGNEFATRLRNAFVIGHGAESAVALPRGKGIARSIFEQREARLKK